MSRAAQTSETFKMFRGQLPDNLPSVDAAQLECIFSIEVYNMNAIIDQEGL